MLKALEISTEVNLAGYSSYLRGQGVAHRISEEGLNQVVWVADENAIESARQAYENYQRVDMQVPVSNRSVSSSAGFVTAVLQFPLTIGLIVINVLLFPVGMWRDDDPSSGLFGQMMLLEVTPINGSYYFVPFLDTIADGQWWRLVTPMLIHFSWLLIVFNLLWVWEIGRRIEIINGALLLFALVLISAVCSSLLQLLMGGPNFFGGMSGVVFGLLGYSLVWSRLVPDRSTAVPNTIYIFMLVYLAVGFTGAIDLLGLGSLANGAHLGGLIAGLVTGGLTGLVVRSRLSRQT